MKTNNDKKFYIKKIIIMAIMLGQLCLVFLSQIRIIANTDGIFSYTLANNPYIYNFIDANYDEFPNNNGWIDAHILREHYVVEKYDRFNYSSVYHHQKYDVHPPLYYFMVHTFSSLFPGTYSILYTMLVNLISLLLIDFLIIKLFDMLYGGEEYSIIPFTFLLLMNSMQLLYTWARMYMLLFLFCTWYLCINVHLITSKDWKKIYLLKMICCIFLGTLTHYYFYVYAATLSLLCIGLYILQKRKYELFNYIYSAIIGLALSWIFYPWVMWHIFENPQNKHTNIAPWSLDKIKNYGISINEKLFNGRIWIAVLILMCLYLCINVFRSEKEKTKEQLEHRCLQRIIGVSGVLYSIIIFTLDEGSAILYYWTAFYVAFIIWFSMMLIDLIKKISVLQGRKGFIIVIAVMCVVVTYSTSVMNTYIKNAKSSITRLLNNESFKNEFYKVSEEYKQYDCIYIEKVQNGLFDNLWFEFGEYDEFKKISLNDFEEYGISVETLAGRQSAPSGKGIIIYAPSECLLDESKYLLLASNNEYNIYKIIDEEKE